MNTNTFTTTAIFEKLDSSILQMLSLAVEKFPKHPKYSGQRVLFAMEDVASAWQFGCITFDEYDTIMHALFTTQLLPLSMMDDTPY